MLEDLRKKMPVHEGRLVKGLRKDLPQFANVDFAVGLGIEETTVLSKVVDADGLEA